MRWRGTPGRCWSARALLLVPLLLLPSKVWAQSTADKAAAEGLFDQGRAAMQTGDFANACPLLERSQHIDPAVGTLLYLAECYEKAGRSASAWATFREAADAADAAHEKDRALLGRKRAERLVPLLSRLTIQVPTEDQSLSGLEIERAGQSVKTALWNVPVPVDPGEYSVTAVAPGYEAWSQTIVVPDRGASISVTLPPLKKRADAPVSPPPPVSASSSPPPAAQTSLPPPGAALPEADATASKRGVHRTAAFVVGGAGVVAIGIGSVFGVRAITKNHEAESHCPRGYQCDDQLGPKAGEDAKKAARIADITLGLGAAALVGGAVLYFTAPSASHGGTAAHFTATAGPGGIVLGGTFQ